jgi:hypothetical protein
MPNPRSLDALLGEEEPHATFHDAVLTAVRIDEASRRFVADLTLSVGDPGAPDTSNSERRRRGRLIVDDMSIWQIESPNDTAASLAGGLWMTSHGPLADAPTDSGQSLARDLKPGHVGWFLFFKDVNGFAYLAGGHFEFQWA